MTSLSDAVQASQEPRTEPEVASGRPAPLWRNRDYLCLWTGEAVSSLGTSMSTIAYPLLVLFATGSVARAGFVTAASMLGTVISTIWGGVLADRISRKAMLVCAPLVQAAAVGTVALLVVRGHPSIVALAVAAAAGGLAEGVRDGARVPALRRIVAKEQMAVASSQVQGRDITARFLGGPVAGVLFAVARWIPFGADAASFLFSSLGAVLIRRPLGPDRAVGPVGPRSGLLADAREGLRYVAGVPFLRFIAIWTSAINMIGGAYFLLFIALLRYRGAGPETIGVDNSIALIGGIAGALAGPALLRRVPAKVVFLAGGWIGAVGAVLTAVAPAPWEVGCSVFIVMLVLVPLNAILQSYQVRLVPDEISGRVGAVVGFGAQGLMWLGPLAAGLLADNFGPPTAGLIVAACLLPTMGIAHLVKSLDVLSTPVEEVGEHPC
jgi:MFS family permease